MYLANFFDPGALGALLIIFFSIAAAMICETVLLLFAETPKRSRSERLVICFLITH